MLRAIVRIACKSLASSDDDVQCEIAKLKAANLLPLDFQLSNGKKGSDGKLSDRQSFDKIQCVGKSMSNGQKSMSNGQKSMSKSQKSMPSGQKRTSSGQLSFNENNENDNNPEEYLIKNAAQLVENIICKVKQQLEDEQGPDDEERCHAEIEQYLAATTSNCSRQQSQIHNTSSKVSNDECTKNQQQVLQCSLALLDQQTDAIIKDVERIRQQVADRMVSEITCGEVTPGEETDGTQSRLSTSQGSTKRKSDASRNGSVGGTNATSKRASNAKKGKHKNSRKSSDKNRSSNAVIVESSEQDSDDDDELDEIQDKETESSDDSDKEMSEDEQPWKNSARTKTSSRCRLPLNRNCNAATGSQCGCGGRIASCNVQDVLDRETLCRALEACDNDQMPVSDVELRKFAGEVVESLYAAVRAKLSTMLDAEYADAGGEWPFPKDELLAKADEEVRSQVLPVVVEHIEWLMKEERRALGQLDCDMMMIAFAGQFVDTIVTNAVLKTQVDLSGKRAYTRTFVATSNGGSSSGSGKGRDSGSGSTSGVGNGVNSISRSSTLKLDNEQLQNVWSWSSDSAQVLAPGDKDKGRKNTNSNCNNPGSSRPTLARFVAGTGWTAIDSCPEISRWSQRRQTDNILENESTVYHSYNSGECGINSSSNNNNKYGNDDDTNRSTAESVYNACTDTIIGEEGGTYSTTSVFDAGYWLPKNVLYPDDDCKHSSWSNNCANNYNGNNNCAESFSDDDENAGDVTAADDEDNDDDDDDDHCHHAQDAQSCDDCNNKADTFINHTVKKSSPISRDRPTREKASSDDEQEAVAIHSSSVAVFHDDVDGELHRYLSTTVNGLLSTLGSRYLARRVLNSAAEWLNLYRTSIDLPRFYHRQCCNWRIGRLQQAHVRAGRALLDQLPLDPICRLIVHQTASRLFRRAVDGAVRVTHDVERNRALHAVDDAQASLIVRTRSLWHQAIETSELLLMKTAIRANFYDFHTPARALLLFLLSSNK